MRKKIALAGMLLAVVAVKAHPGIAADSPSIPLSKINAPNGIAGLDATGSLTAPLKGPADNATVGGKSLQTIIPALERQQRISEAIPTAWINTANGVVGTDGNITFNLPGGSFYSTYQSNLGLNTTVPTFAIGANGALTNYMNSVGIESVLFGGMASSDGRYVSSVNLGVKGMPSGYQNAGCSLCVVSAAGDWNSKLVNISNTDPTTGAAALTADNGYGVGIYEYSQNYGARVAAQALSFTATTVTLANNMTAAQQSTLHAGMYVATNVQLPSASANDTNGLPEEVTYWGILKSWTSNTMTVYAWGPMGTVANAQPAAVPDATKVETIKSNYSVPMVFVGAPKRTIGQYTVGSMDANQLYGTASTSRSNKYDGHITDISALNFRAANTLQARGSLVRFNCGNCTINPLTKNSYGFGVEGQFPAGFSSSVSPGGIAGGVEYLGDSTYIPGPFMSSTTTQAAQHVMTSTAAQMVGNTSPSSVVYMSTTLAPTSATTSPSKITDYTIYMGPNIGATRSGDLQSGGSALPGISWATTQGNSSKYTSICLTNTKQQPAMCVYDGYMGTAGVSSIVFNAPSLFGQSVDMSSNDILNIGAADATSRASTNGTQYDVKGRLTSGVDAFGIPAVGILGYSQSSVGGAQSTAIDFGFGNYASSTHGANALAGIAPVFSITPTAVVSYIPVTTTGSTTDTISGAADFKSKAFTSSISGRTGGSAKGNYSVSLFAEERVGNWTSAILRFNGYSGILDWRFNEDGTIITPAGKVIADSSSLGNQFLLANGGQAYGEFHYSYSGISSFIDPDSGVSRDAKFGNKGIAVIGGIKTDTITTTIGTLNAVYAYATLPSSPTVPLKVYCSDCYSTLRDDVVKPLGLEVVWTGKYWVDGVGNPVRH